MNISKSFKILSYNIHKGFNLGNTQYTLDLIKKGILDTGADILCLQEVCGPNPHRHKVAIHPLHTQFEFLADGAWPHFAYGKNAVYKQGNHGNAILCKFPIKTFHNLDLSTNRFERRGLLHAQIEISNTKSLHILTAHLDLLEAGRLKQCQKINNYILNNVGKNDQLILAGDFNDWREKLSSRFKKESFLEEAFLIKQNSHARSFPSFAPFMKLDRIYFRNLNVLETQRLSGSSWKKLSDHTPLSADFEFNT